MIRIEFFHKKAKYIVEYNLHKKVIIEGSSVGAMYTPKIVSISTVNYKNEQEELDLEDFNSKDIISFYSNIYTQLIEQLKTFDAPFVTNR